MKPGEREALLNEFQDRIYREGPEIFEEITRKYQSVIKTKIRANPKTFSAQQLHMIQDTLSKVGPEANKKRKSYGLELQVLQINNEMVTALYQEVRTRLNQEQIETVKKWLADFENGREALRELFDNELRAVIGDTEKGYSESDKILKSLREHFKSKQVSKLLADIKRGTHFDGQMLIARSDLVVERETHENNRMEFIQYATNVVELLKETFKQIYDERVEQLVLKTKEKINLSFNQALNRLIEKFESFDATSECLEKCHEHKRFLNYYQLARQDFPFLFADRIIDPNVDVIQNFTTFRNVLSEGFQIVAEDSGLFVGKCLDSLQSDSQSEQVLHDYDINLINALGCCKTCPYCGAKCSGEQGHKFHYANKHRTMGFTATHTKDRNRGSELVTDICDSAENEQSLWRDVEEKERQGAGQSYQNKTNEDQADEARFRERVGLYGLTLGELSLTLSWSDPNDLDLYIKCPCGTEIHWNSVNVPYVGDILNSI